MVGAVRGYSTFGFPFTFMRVSMLRHCAFTIAMLNQDYGGSGVTVSRCGHGGKPVLDAQQDNMTFENLPGILPLRRESYLDRTSWGFAVLGVSHLQRVSCALCV